MRYKPSIFNFYTNDNQDLLLVNFKLGIKSFHIVSGSDVDEVKLLLNASSVEDVDHTPIIKSLIEKGFLIPYEYDEQKERSLLQLDYIYSNKLQLVIHVTNDCNFRCKYCFLDFKTQKMSLTTQNGVIEFIRNTIHKYSGIYISWFGGEPLMGMDVITHMSQEIIEICKRARKTYMAGITTNGYYLTPENIQYLLKLKVYSYYITLDGLSNTHDNQRILADGEPTFDIIIENLRYLRHKVKFRHLNVCIRTNLTKSILDNLTKYLSFYEKEFGKDPRFSLFLRLADDWGGERVETIRTELLTPPAMEKIYDTLFSHPTAFSLHNFVSLYFGGLTCNAVRKYKYTISTDGIISKCDTACAETAIGRLDDSGWHIDKEKESKWLLAYQKNSEKCEVCPFSVLCFQGACPKKNILHNGIRSCPKPIYMEKLLLLYKKAIIQREENPNERIKY